MTNRLLWTLLATLALALPAVGCHGLDRYYDGNCGGSAFSGRISGRGECGGGCGGSCGNADCGTTGSCGAGGDCGAGPSCGAGGCCPHPFRNLWRSITCSSGCGEFYFDEWINDPPERCDPCDDYGRYAGPQGGCQKWLRSGRGRMSYRCGRTCDTSCGYEGGCGTPGCNSCGQSADGHDETIETPMPAQRMQRMEPTPAVESARRPTEAYYTKPGARRVSHTQPTAQPRVLSSSTRTARHAQPTEATRPIGSGVHTTHR
ncbi:MAG TPA: hypothetical protein VL096_02965 [Pirellulaceae bacterium]|nr:hypothetical protein [Pirellulaceae bacterium]